MSVSVNLVRITVSRKPKIRFTSEIREIIECFPNENKEIVLDFFKKNNIDIYSDDKQVLNISTQMGKINCKENVHEFFSTVDVDTYCTFFGRDRIRLLSILMVSGEVNISIKPEIKFGHKITYIINSKNIISKNIDDRIFDDFFNSFSSEK